MEITVAYVIRPPHSTDSKSRQLSTLVLNHLMRILLAMNFTYPKSLQSPEDSSRSSSPDLIFPDQFPSLDGSSRIGQSAHSRAHPTYSSSQYGVSG